MYFSKSTIISLGLLATAELVAGHAAIIGATGDAGGQGSAIGVDPQTPRDGTRRNPFQQDATRFRNENADQCGETLGGGANDVESGTAQVMAQNGNTLPQVTPGGEISMTLHQVNGDGAGPYTCMIDATGTGTQWTPIQVTQNVDGNARGRNNDQQMQDLPLTAAIPANQECTGTVAGQSNVCMVRCQNPARAGPFGGCVPVQMAGAAANNTDNANANAGNANAGNANANTGNVNNGNANAGNANTGNANTGNANTGNANTGNANTQVPATGNANTGNVNTGNNVQQAPATGNVGNANGNLNGQANANTGNANTIPQTGNTGNANTQNTNGNVGANTGNANTAGTPALTNDDQQEEVGLQRRVAKQLGTNGPIVTDDDQEEEVELLEGSFARRWVVPSN